MRDRLKILISETGLSQKEFAERINISSSAITQFIKGQSKGLNSDTIQSIISVYNINPTWLLTGEGEMFNTPSDVKDGKVSYTAITDISDISKTKWFKNLSKEQREIITHL
ncbi:MAG TPA: helix-turn-helix transcriptional regulator, partial [Spirochaetota bacterium]|nr:helix-turn-helix transcriptional regulator [Spirochaetota bacterium]